MQKLVFTNGGGQSIDLTSGNFGITNWEGLSNADLNIQTQQVPFQDGGVFLDALIEQREISVTVAIQDNNDLALRYELKRQLISALNPKLGEGVLVYTNDYLSRQIKAVPQLPIFENKNSNDAGTLKASVVFSCPSPYWEDLEETEITFVNGDILDIENNGDIDVYVKMNGMFSSDFVSIKNETNQKPIGLLGQEAGEYLINTNIGQKEIKKIKRGLNYLLSDCTSFAIDDNGDILILTNAGIITKIEGFFNFSYIKAPAYGDCISIANGTYFIGTDGYMYKSEDLKTFDVVISGTYMYKVIYGKEKYIAIVQSSYRLYTSTDKINWTLQDVEMNIRDIVYSAEKDLFVIVGSSGNIKTSPDAITWTSQTSGTSEGLNAIIYSATREKFIVVGGNGVILTSSDAITWTLQTSGITEHIGSVCCNNEYIFATSSAGLLKSTDGTNWSLLEIYFSKILYKDYFVGMTASGEVRISKNGENFTILNSQKGQFFYSNVRDLKKYGNKMFAYGQFQTDIRIYMTEDNWQTWDLYPIDSFNYQRIEYVYDGQKFVYIANRKVSSSTDFENWNTFDFGEVVNSITYSKEDGKFVVSSNSHLWVSEDLSNWSSLDVTGMLWVTYSEYYHKYFAISSTKVYESTDLETWNVIRDNDGNYGRIEEKEGILAIFTNNKFSYKRPNANWVVQSFNASERISFCVIKGIIYLLCQNKIYKIDSKEVMIDANITLGNYALSLLNNNDILYVSGFIYIGDVTKIESETNQIDKLTANSDMNFNLSKGNNRIVFSNANGSVTFSYRQKYLGV